AVILGQSLRGQALVDRRPIPRLLERGALHARHAPRQRQLPHLVVAPRQFPRLPLERSREVTPGARTLDTFAREVLRSPVLRSPPMATKVFHYPNCSTCRKALKWLDAHGVAYEAVDIVAAPPTKAELQRA